MKNLIVALSGVILAVLLYWLSLTISIIIIFLLCLLVFVWLFYQAQLLPEDIMTFLDNKIIHDGETTLSKNESRDVTIDSPSSNVEDNTIENEIEDESLLVPDKRISQSEELFKLVVEKSAELGIEIKPLDGLSEWLSVVDTISAEKEILLLVQKMNQASGISKFVKLRFNGNSLEVQI